MSCFLTICFRNWQYVSPINLGYIGAETLFTPPLNNLDILDITAPLILPSWPM